MNNSNKKNTELPSAHDRMPEKQDVERPEVIRDQDANKGNLTKVEQSMFVGPIPPPEILRGYEEVLSGSADRILAMAEKEQAHRHSNEDEIVKNKVNKDNDELAYKKRGQILGTILAILLMGCGVYFAYADHADVSKIIYGGTILGVIVVYILHKLPWSHTDKGSTDKSQDK